MKTKTIFLWMLLALLVGGVNEAWATDYVLSQATYSTQQSSGSVTTWRFSNGLTITNTKNKDATKSTGQNNTYKFSNGVQYTISGIPENKVITGVSFYGYDNAGENGYIQEFNGESYTSSTTPLTFGTVNEEYKTCTFSSLSITSGSFTFTGYKQLAMIITITTEDRTIDNIYSGSYPYTWDFTVETNKWAKSISEMQASGSGNNWNVNTSGSYAHPTMALNTEIGLDDVDIIKGLRFKTNANSDLYLNWNDKYLWINSSSDNYVSVPNLTAGQIVTFTTTGATMAAVSGAVSTGTNNQFLITASGSVSFYTTNTDGVNIKKIAVTNQDITPYNSSTIVYEWKFNDSSWWVTTSGMLSSSWYSNDNIYIYSPSISSTSTLYVNGSAELPETNNLSFQNAKQSRVGVKIGEFLWINTNTVVTLPSLPVGIKITIRARKHGGGSSATMNVSNATLTSEKNISSSDQDFVYTVNSVSPVTITANNGVIYIGSIKIEKNDLPFTEKKVQVHPNIVTKSTAYTGSTQVFWVETNVPDNLSMNNTSYYTVTSSNSSVINVSNFGVGHTSGFLWFNALNTGNVGTSVVTFTFNGNDIYNPASFSVTLSVTKGNPTLAFTIADKGTDSQTYSQGMTYSNALTYPADITTSKISYSSSNPSVATINSSTGAISVVAPGTTTIRATFAGDDNYNSASTYFTLTLNGSTGPTIAWESGKAPSDVTSDGYDASSSTVTMTYGQHDNTLQCVASVTSGSGTVNYISDDTSVATVASDGKVTLKGIGTATITAFVPGTSSGTNPSNYLTYNIISYGGSFSLQFQPNSGYVNAGSTIAPHLNLPTIELDDISELKLTVYSDAGCTTESEAVARVVATSGNLLSSDYLKMQGTKVNGVYPIIEGVSTGTAYVKASFKSNGVYADAVAVYQVTVTSASTCNFRWDNLKDDNNNEVTDYYLTTGEYMFIPTISGNSNGNFFGYNNGSVCLAEQAYVYTIKNGNVEWNNEDYYHGEGIPNYDLTSNGGTAYIFYCKGQNLRTHRLMIYGLSAGDVILTATDPQTGIGCGEITIHIVDKATNVTTVNTTYWGAHTFPYTWDFTNVSASDITDDGIHWIAGSSNEHKLGMATSLSYDYADEDNNGISFTGNSGSSTRQDLEKYFTNVTKTSGEWSGCELMPQFYGLTLTTGNSSSGSYESKVDRLSLYDSEASDPGLSIVGGTHNIFLPAIPSSSPTYGKAFKVIMKVMGNTIEYKKNTTEIDPGNSSHVNCHVREANGSYTTIYNEMVVYTNGAKEIFDFDIPAEHSGKVIRLGFDQNVKVYWIALSTEAKPVYQPTSTTYPASTYSYTKALDLDKSAEVNTGLTTYYASGFNSSTNSVTMTSLTGRVEANRGLMLKLPATNKTDDDTPSSSCYMIADPENSESYSVPTTLNNVTNYLIATGNTSTTPKRFYPENTHDNTNFILTNTYHKILDNTETDEVTSTSDAITDDWKYVRTAGDIVVGANKAYLRLPGRLLNINASARAMSESTANSRTVLNIVFDDEQDVTGIQSLHTASNAGSDDDGWHTLQGVKVSTPTRGGLYIYKGKKIAVK